MAQPDGPINHMSHQHCAGELPLFLAACVDLNSIRRGLTWKRRTCWYLEQTRQTPPPGVQFCSFVRGACLSIVLLFCMVIVHPFEGDTLRWWIWHMPSVITPAAGRRPYCSELSPPHPPPKKVFFFLLNIKSPHLPCNCFLFPRGLPTALGVLCGEQMWTSRVYFCLLGQCASTKTGGEPVWDFGRSVLILGGPFLRGPCFEADIQTRLRRRTKMDPTLRACGILIPAFAACHAVHSSQLKADFQIKVTVKSVPRRKA